MSDEKSEVRLREAPGGPPDLLDKIIRQLQERLPHVIREALARRARKQEETAASARETDLTRRLKERVAVAAQQKDPAAVHHDHLVGQ